MIPYFHHILYATDLSGDARKALGYAVSLADVYGAALTVIHVLEETAPNAELLISAFLGYSSRDEMKLKSRDKVIDEVKARLDAMARDLGCKLPTCRFILSDILVETGRTEHILVDRIEKGDYDLLVVGRHHYGLIEEKLIGHKTNAALRHSRIPVLLIPLEENAG